MPIDITCSDCSESYKVPDDVAGKKIRCPKCNVATIQVPNVAAEAATAAMSGAVGSAAATMDSTYQQTQSVQYQMKTETGDIYGPVDKTELDQWVSEGRVTAKSQLLPTGGSQWQWATDLYPHLATTTAVSPVVSSGQPYQHQYANKQQAYSSQQRGPVGSRSKVVAGILGILIGAFGVHNFYLGFHGKAVAQLLITVLSCGVLAGISSIWALIEGIMILTGGIDRDADGYLLQD